jgi:cation transport regulator ChaC
LATGGWWFHLRRCAECGHVGSCAEYLLETVSHLEELGIRDRRLWRLQAMVAARLGDGGSS